MYTILKMMELLDATIIAIMGNEVLSAFLIGSLMLAVVGLCQMLKDAASGRDRKK